MIILKKIVASENVFYGFDIYSMRNATNSEEHTRTEILTRSAFFPNKRVILWGIEIRINTTL